MNRTITVCLDVERRVVGRLRYAQEGRRENASFEYSGSWLSGDDRFAIDPRLPLMVGPQFRKRSGTGSLFHGAIADTEPDGWGRRVILRDHAKRRAAARSAASSEVPPVLGELDFLLAVDDYSRIGALRFRSEDGAFQASTEGYRRAPPLLDLSHLLSASRAVERSTETAADLAYLRGRGTSLGGLRPKCTVIDEGGHLAIGKFPSVSDQRAVVQGEVLALRLARKAGITAADARIVRSEDAPVALIRRFDRTEGAGRIPYCSAATLLGVERDDEADHAYTEIVDAIRVHGYDAQRDIEELFRRIAFSVAINNVDDHLHNHGFLYVGDGRWRLAPAFDVNPFPDRARELKTWISPDAGPVASLEALRATVPYFRLTPDKAEAIIAEVRTAVSTWRSVGVELGMSTGELDAFSDAFEGALER